MFHLLYSLPEQWFSPLPLDCLIALSLYPNIMSPFLQLIAILLSVVFIAFIINSLQTHYYCYYHYFAIFNPFYNSFNFFLLLKILFSVQKKLMNFFSHFVKDFSHKKSNIFLNQLILTFSSNECFGVFTKCNETLKLWKKYY